MKNFKYGEPLSLFAHGQAGDGSLAEAEEFGLPRRVISLKTDSKRATALGWLTGLTRRRIKADSLREDLPEFAYKSEAGAAAKFGQTALPMELQYEAFESTYSRVWTKIFLIVPKSFNILFNQYKLDKVCQFITWTDIALIFTFQCNPIKATRVQKAIPGDCLCYPTSSSLLG